MEIEAKRTIAFHTLGCKLNQAESESLARQLTEAGYVVNGNDRANIHILNTCTVTHTADRKSRRWLKTMRLPHRMLMIFSPRCKPV